MAEQLLRLDDMTRFLGDVAATQGNSKIILWRPWETGSSDTYGLDVEWGATMYLFLLNQLSAVPYSPHGSDKPLPRIENVDEAITFLNSLRGKRGNIPILAQFTDLDMTQPIYSAVVKSNGSYTVVLTNEEGAEVLRDQYST